MSNRFSLPSPSSTPDPDKPMTPAQCRAVAESLRDLPPQYQLSAAELEMIEEETHGQPLRYGEPTAAAVAMKLRLGVLLDQKRQALATMDDCDEALFQTLVADCRQLDQQIAATRQRLDDYHRQQGEAN